MPSTKRPNRQGTSFGVGRVVQRALSELVPEGQAMGDMRRPLETYVTQMIEACLAPSPSALHEVVATMRRAWISGPIISDVYVPIVARRLGEAWVADALHFTSVTIGSARLQSLLRRLDGDWSMAPDLGIDGTRSYLVGLPEGEQHTLGVTVLAGHLRQKGYCVHVDLELTPDRIARHLSTSRFSAVLLSLPQQECLESLSQLVDKSKEISRNTPVIVGGAHLKQDNDIKSLMLADIVTCDVPEALAFIDASYAAVELEKIQLGRDDSQPGLTHGFRIVAE